MEWRAEDDQGMGGLSDVFKWENKEGCGYRAELEDIEQGEVEDGGVDR